MTAISISQVALVALVSRGGARFAKQVAPAPPDPTTLSNGLAKLSTRWFQVSELARFFISGNVGNLCFFMIERVVYGQLCQLHSLPKFLEEYKESVSFFIGYLLQIISQHLIHAVLVYGLHSINTREKYLQTLLGQFQVYSLALVGSTFFNLFLLRAGLDKTVAFFTTMVTFACINYYLVGWIVQRATKRASAEGKRQQAETTSAASATKRGGLLNGRGSSKPTGKDDGTAAVKRIRRGGAGWDLPSRRWFDSSLSIHELVRETSVPIDVDAINNSSE
jgi:hypothetical protein